MPDMTVRGPHTHREAEAEIRKSAHELGAGEGNRTPDLRFTSLESGVGGKPYALLAEVVTVRLCPLLSGALAALLAAHT
jgi:hypothetical protein